MSVAQIECSGGRFDLFRFRWKAELGRAGAIEVDARNPSFRPQPGETLKFCFDGGTCDGLRVVGRRGDLWCCEKAPPAAGAPPDQLRAFQRQEGETPADFVSRVMQAFQQTWAAPDGSDAPLDPPPMEKAWPPGTVCLLPRHDDGRECAGRLLDVIRESAPSLQGVCAGLDGDGAANAGSWRLRFHLPVAKNDTFNCDIGSEWRIAPSAGSAGGFWVARDHAGAAPGDSFLRDLLGSLFDPEARIVKVDSWVFPRLPMTVHLGRQDNAFFCRSTVVQLERDDAKGTWKLDVWLELKQGTPRASWPRPSPRVVLAECAKLPEDDGKKFYRVRPPSAPPAEPELLAATLWQAGHPDQSLLAARIVPGFVRKDRAAFYSRLAVKEDLVWLRLAHGEVPLILGALHQRIDRWETGEEAADVVLNAEKIHVTADAAGASLRLEADKAVVSAPKQLTWRAPNAEVSDRLNVKGAASFSDDVSLG